MTISPATRQDAETLAALTTELGYPVDSAAMRERLSAILADHNTASLVLVRSIQEEAHLFGLGLGRSRDYALRPSRRYSCGDFPVIFRNAREK